MRLTSAATLLAFALTAGAVRPAAAEFKNFLEIVPAENYGWVAVNNLSELDRALMRTGGLLGLEGRNPLEFVKDRLNLQQGLREDGAWGLFCIPRDGGVAANPGAAPAELEHLAAAFMAVPVTDFAAFVKNFEGAQQVEQGLFRVQMPGKDMARLVRKVGQFAVFTEEENRDALLKLTAGGQAFEAVKLSADQMGRIRDNHIVARISNTGLTSLADLIAAQTKKASGDITDQDQKRAVEMFVRRMETVRSFLTQAKGGLVTVGFEDKGVRIRQVLNAQEGTELAKFFANQAEFDKDVALLKRLPAGNWTLAFGAQGHDPQSRLVDEAITGFLREMNAAEKLDKAALDDIRKDLRGSFEGLRLVNGALYAPAAGEPKAAADAGKAKAAWVPMGFIFADDARAYLDRFRQYQAAVNKVMTAAGWPADQAAPAAVKVDDLIFDRVEFNAGKRSPFGMFKGRGEQGGNDLFGMMDEWLKGGKHFYVAVLDQNTLIWAMGGEEQLRAAVRMAKGGQDLTVDPLAKRALNDLPQKAHAVLAINPKPLAKLAGRFYVAAVALNPNLVVPELKDTAAVAMAFHYEPKTAVAEWIVPNELLSSLGDWTRQLRQGNAPAGGAGGAGAGE